MSSENGKVCCNCRHCIRIENLGWIDCVCVLNNSLLSYQQIMAGFCRHWSKKKEIKDGWIDD